MDRFSPLCVISGGTVGGYPRTNDLQSFKLIELVGALGPRVAATVRQIPLNPVNVPANVINQEARVFNVVLADRFPHLHDLEVVKEAFDADLVGRLAPELGQSDGLQMGGPTISAGGKLFGTIYQYRCYACIDRVEGRTFYEVMQATKAVKFGTLARIRWLVTELLTSHQTQMDRPTNVVLLIGNLEDTHYSEASRLGETAASIDGIRTWLGPALTASLIDIRTHTYSQREVADLTVRRPA